MSYNIAIVGSTGAVGREMLETLSYRKFPCKNVYALASKSSSASTLSNLSSPKETSLPNEEFEANA